MGRRSINMNLQDILPTLHICGQKSTALKSGEVMKEEPIQEGVVGAAATELHQDDGHRVEDDGRCFDDNGHRVSCDEGGKREEVCTLRVKCV